MLLPAIAIAAVIDGDVERDPSALCSAVSPVEMRWLRTGPPGADAKPRVPMPDVPAGLAARVALWERVWGELETGQYLLVDERRPWMVHAEVDCRGLPRVDCMIKKSAARERAKKTVKRELRFVEGRRDSLARVVADGADDIAKGEAMFDLLRVPREYARLAVVESMLRDDALSPAGAVGPYQLMPLIAERYLMVRDGVDERRDPVRSSLAAAKYLRRLHGELGSWPLALTAYHAGPTRLRARMKAFGTRDVAKLTNAGDERGEFGWASQNYYAKVMAVARVTAELEVERMRSRDFAVRVNRRMPLRELAACVHADVAEVKDANPSLSQPIRDGEQPVPKDYVALVRVR